jgi:copper chaperone CopZ
MNRVLYNVPNISCEHCVHTIKTELEDLDGVRSVEGDFQTKQVTVTFEAPATEQQIVALMTEINYPPEL